MNESAYTTKLRSALKAKMPGAVIFKHSDAITSGVPDLSVTWRGRTWWIEVKKDRIAGKGLQAERMEQLARVGNARYIVFRQNSVVLIDPQEPTYEDEYASLRDLVDFLIRIW